MAKTFRDFEIIGGNDGCTGDTEEVLRPYVEKNLIRHFYQENQGISATRNRGLSLAFGEFVAFLDDGDMWPPDKSEWQVDALQNSRALVVAGNLFGLIDVPGFIALTGMLGFVKGCGFVFLGVGN